MEIINPDKFVNKDIEYLDRVELKKKIVHLRDKIKKIVLARCDDICWRDVYTDLAAEVGVYFEPELIDEPYKHLINCSRFIDSLRDGKYTPIYHERKAESPS